MPVEYKILVDDICGFRSCKKTITHRTINKTLVDYYEEEIKQECCEGYAITPERTCSPICLRSCGSGKCIAPNQCECTPAPVASQPGYAGPQCNRFVCAAEDRWGPECDMTCQCPDRAFCDARTGKCSCRPGYRGTNCTEECDQKSGCDDLPYVVPLFERVNIIKTDDTVVSRGMSASLVAEPLADRDPSDDKNAFSRMLMTHLQINLFLIILASGLMFALFCYKKKLSQLKNELYYAAYPGSRDSDSSSGGYSSVYNSNGGSDIARRPPMPLPGEAASYPSKNLSFDSATRNALRPGKGDLQSHVHLPIQSKTERHLAMSKEESTNNIYSDIESNLDSSCAGLPFTVSKNQLSVTSTENEYQVPRSPANRSLNETNSHANLYEELAPNHQSPNKKSEADQK